MATADIVLKNSERSGLRVLFLDTDLLRATRFEALWDADKELNRTELYVAENLAAAKRAVRQRNHDLALIVDRFDGKSLAALMLELRATHKAIEVIGVLDQPDLPSLRECNMAGPLIDLTGPADLQSFEAIRDLILNGLRSLQRKEQNYHRATSALCLSIVNVVGRLLPELASSKAVSGHIMQIMLPTFDLNAQLSTTALFAERLFFPSIPTADYAALLVDVPTTVAALLEQCGSRNKPPSSAAGLLITAANYLAEATVAGAPPSSSEALLRSHPVALHHRAIRAFTPEVLAAIVEAPSGLSKIS